MEFFRNLEKLFGEIPQKIKEILIHCGYDNLISISEINTEEIEVIEKYVNQNESMKHLRSGEIFGFPPGHKKLLMYLAQKASQLLLQFDSKTSNAESSNIMKNATFIMKELINSMTQNANRPATGHRYTEAIQWFATYIYMVGGKAAYEVLCNNLPLPQDSTICK